MPHQGCKMGTRGPPLPLEAPRALLGMTAALQEGSHGAKDAALSSPAKFCKGIGGHPRLCLKSGLPLHQGSADYRAVSPRAGLKDMKSNCPGTCPRVWTGGSLHDRGRREPVSPLLHCSAFCQAADSSSESHLLPIFTLSPGASHYFPLLLSRSQDLGYVLHADELL